MKWHPIWTAPKAVDVLVYGLLRDGSGSYQQVCQFYRDRWPVEWMHNCLPPTHWMPLPWPPSDDA